MSRYRLTDFSKKYAYLRRRSTPIPDVIGQEWRTEVHSLGEAFPLPDKSSPLFATLKLEPTLLGRLVKTIFKPTQLHVTLSLANGTTRTYRIISTMVRSGFVLSPLVTSTLDFAQLISGNQDILDGTRVKNVKVWADIAWLPLWKSSFEIAYTILRPEQYDGPTSVFSRIAQIPTNASIAKADCNGVIDYVNHQLMGRKRTAAAARYLAIRGWLISADGKGRDVPSEVLINIRRHGGDSSYYVATRTPRQDVKAHFKRPDLPDVGYTARIDIPSDLKTYTVTVGAKVGNMVTLCRNLSVQIEP